MGRNKEVEAWFARYDNPMKDVVQRVREIVLGADARIEECIKWQAPTFTYLGNLASFFPRSKQHASLMFHMGAQIPGKHARLEGAGGSGRVLKVGSLREANAAKAEIVSVVRAWCTWREEVAGKRSGKTSATKGKQPSGGKSATGKTQRQPRRGSP
jgi:uncharacterized protein YdhG (YjbR/CyaY superfamily)